MDFTREDVAGRILELTGGEGVDTAIEALGAEVSDQKLDDVVKTLVTF